MRFFDEKIEHKKNYFWDFPQKHAKKSKKLDFWPFLVTNFKKYFFQIFRFCYKEFSFFHFLTIFCKKSLLWFYKAHFKKIIFSNLEKIFYQFLLQKKMIFKFFFIFSHNLELRDIKNHFKVYLSKKKISEILINFNVFWIKKIFIFFYFF